VKTGRGENRCPSILPDPLAGGDISRLDQAERLHRQVLGDVAVVLTLGEQGVAAEDATSRGDVAGGDGEVRASANQLGVLEAGGADASDLSAGGTETVRSTVVKVASSDAPTAWVRMWWEAMASSAISSRSTEPKAIFVEPSIPLPSAGIPRQLRSAPATEAGARSAAASPVSGHDVVADVGGEDRVVADIGAQGLPSMRSPGVDPCSFSSLVSVSGDRLDVAHPCALM
jgi:hypothetical protein